MSINPVISFSHSRGSDLSKLHFNWLIIIAKSISLYIYFFIQLVNMENLAPLHTQRLLRNITFLVDDLTVEDVLPFLVQEGVFTMDDCERIQHEVTRRDRAVLLVKLLSSREEEAYKIFRLSLHQLYSHLVDILDNTNFSTGKYLGSWYCGAREWGYFKQTQLLFYIN